MKIDWWTLGIQTVNVVILIWLLQRFFWKPVAAMIEQRRIAAKKALDDAEAKDKEANTKLAEIETTRAGFAKEREVILAEAHKTAEQTRDAGLKQDAKDTASAKEAAAAATQQEKAAADKEWSDRASVLAVEIAQQLVARLESAATRTAFLDWLLQEVRNQPEEIKRAMNNIKLEATSATQLDAAEQERYATQISEALGAHPQITFKADPTLIAGLELSGPNFLVSNSWRSDLSQILVDLKRDNRL